MATEPLRRLLLLLNSHHVHLLNHLDDSITHLVHILLEEAIDIVGDFAGVVRDRELHSLAKLALLVVGVVPKSIIKLREKSFIVFSFHDELLLHNLEEGLLSARLQQVDTSLIVREGDGGDFLPGELRCVHFGGQSEDVVIKLLLKLLISIVNAQLLK